MTKPRQLLVMLAVAVLAAACSGGDDETAARPTEPTATATAPPGSAGLERAVRDAVDENHRLSVYVLWHNMLPAWATDSTRGPALVALRTAAADRRKQGVRVKLVSDRFRITSVRLDPSYTRATAIASGRQRVRPHYLNGQPRGRAVDLNERARIELRRVGRSGRFVVWNVEVLG